MKSPSRLWLAFGTIFPSKSDPFLAPQNWVFLSFLLSGRFGRLLASLGLPLASFWPPLASLWPPLASPWPPLGPLWRPLGLPLATLWRPLASPWRPLASLGLLLASFGIPLASPWHFAWPGLAWRGLPGLAWPGLISEMSTTLERDAHFQEIVFSILAGFWQHFPSKIRPFLVT